MTQQQSWYAAMFCNTCGAPDHALSKYIEGNAWAVQLEGSPGTILYTVQDVVRYMADAHNLSIVRRGER